VYASGESYAVFGHFTYDLTDLWTLDVGARYTTEDRVLQSVEIDVGDSCFFLGSTICEVQPVMNRATVTEDGLYVDTGGTFDDVTPMISFTRTLQGGGRLDDGMVYFLISEGWLTGAFNEEINTFAAPQLEPLIPYGPEHVTNYEVGFKGTMADGRLRIAADVFYMAYKDKQEVVNLDNSDGHLGSDPAPELITNAADVDIYGLELEVRASPWEGGFVTLDAGVLSNEYGEYSSFSEDAGVVDLSDVMISDRTPDWTMTASVEHAFSFGNGATLTPTLGVYVQDGYEWMGGLEEGAPESVCYQDGYAKWRTRLTYEPANGPALFGNNITDERIFEGCGEGRSGLLNYYYAAPEMYGVEFTARWGADN
jgi:iron complex outermembrane receptor protein